MKQLNEAELPEELKERIQSLNKLDIENVSPETKRLIKLFFCPLDFSKGASSEERVANAFKNKFEILGDIIEETYSNVDSTYPKIGSDLDLRHRRTNFREIRTRLTEAAEQLSRGNGDTFQLFTLSAQTSLLTEKMLMEKEARSDRKRANAQGTRDNQMHVEIRCIGQSVAQSVDEHEVTNIVQHRLEKLGYTPTRRTIRTSLQKAGIIRKLADRKKGK